jgi:hypothetical protein
VKGTLIEAMEFASKEKPELINDKAFEFVNKGKVLVILLIDSSVFV